MTKTIITKITQELEQRQSPKCDLKKKKKLEAINKKVNSFTQKILGGNKSLMTIQEKLFAPNTLHT